jgi:hypothetical protein
MNYWIILSICLPTIIACAYTLWKIRFIATNTVDNRKDIRALHTHDKQILSYIKHLNGEFQNAKKEWAKTERQLKRQS